MSEFIHAFVTFSTFLTPCFVLRGGFLYTMIVPAAGFWPASSRVSGIGSGRGGGGAMVLDEIDSCIN